MDRSGFSNCFWVITYCSHPRVVATEIAAVLHTFERFHRKYGANNLSGIFYLALPKTVQDGIVTNLGNIL